MFDSKREPSIRDVLNAMNKEAGEQFAQYIGSKTDRELTDEGLQHLSEIDARIQDRIKMEKGEGSSTLDFTRGLSFYLFDILDEEQKKQQLLSDLNHLERISSFRPLVDSIRGHLDTYQKLQESDRANKLMVYS